MSSAQTALPRGILFVALADQFALVGPDGQYLHSSLTRHDDGTLRRTELKSWRWLGTLPQLHAVYRIHPETKTFTRVRIAREMPARTLPL